MNNSKKFMRDAMLGTVLVLGGGATAGCNGANPDRLCTCAYRVEKIDPNGKPVVETLYTNTTVRNCDSLNGGFVSANAPEAK